MKPLIIFINLIVVFYYTNAIHIQMINSDGLESPHVPDLSPFTKIGNKYYWFGLEQKVNWFEAANTCRTKGAHLISIPSEEENEQLTTYLKENDYMSNFWIGANDLSKEGEFRWHSTGLPLVYNQWGDNQPDNSVGVEQCTHLVYKSAKFVWNDNNCAHSFSFICEAPTPKSIVLSVW